MIRAALIFFILAFLVSIMGVTSAGGMTMEIGHFLLLMFLGLAIVSLCFGMMPTDGEDDGTVSHQQGRDYDYDQSIL